MMMIMQKDYRLINDFKKQTISGIWKHLDAMAVNYAVYSTHLKGLSPFLTDFDVYLYCDASSMVLVCLECCGHHVDRVFNESESLSALIMTEGCEPRPSTVWKLAEAVRYIKIQLQNAKPSMAVYGVLLTEAGILNADELYDMWDANDIMVIDSIKRLKYRRIQVNHDDELSGKTIVDDLIDSSFSLPDTDTLAMSEPLRNEDINPIKDFEYEEFETMMNDFINSEFEETVESDLSEDTDAHLTEDTDAHLTEDTEDPCEEPEDDDTSCADDILFPDGEIEQNQNISVKVDILRPIANPQEELNRLVGCNDIKQRMNELVNLTRYNSMLHELFPTSKQHEISLHSLFLGRPGTGKTTVCKIYGSLLKQAGALSKGHVVVCNRGTFIGTLWGDEERSMHQVLNMAKGGVLMIDEAYLLNSSNANDPGKMVIQLLMNVLADETQRDIAVVLCGYKEPMKKLLDLNPGLQSRFPNRFEFTDFTVDELLEITKSRVNIYEYQFTDKAWEKYSRMISQAYQVRDPETWGNARFIANQLERIYIQHASRCVRQQPKDKSDLRIITTDDIVPIEMPHRKARIGF